MSDTVVMDAQALNGALDRLADEIAEKSRSFPHDLALVGVHTRGLPLSQRLARRLESRTGRHPELGALDITLYRDDLTTVGAQPIVRRTDLPFRVDDSWIVLVDDVLYTGRTVRAAITALVDFGRPKSIELLVLVDRGWRELPIQADYTGLELETRAEHRVRVHLTETDAVDEVVLHE